jgi:N-acetylmuramoyl-L-alanine amidase
MPTTHQVQQGECLVSIAESYGFFWETLWNLPENKAIREARRDPTVLLPGDVVTIPEKTVKEYVRPTGARHTFRVKNVPARLNLRLRDEGGNPRAGLAYVLIIDGVETRGTTDGDGAVRAPIPPTARRGALRVTDETGEEESYELDLGTLDPADTVRGAQARLAQMGAYAGAVDGRMGEAFSAALRSYQASQGLTLTGELDASTQASLRETHGG